MSVAAMAFTLSFDAQRALAVEIGIREGLAWMAPVAIDVAQAAAMWMVMRLGRRRVPAPRADVLFCRWLAVATAGLSVAGNGYHTFGVAAELQRRAAVGEDLGYQPHSPWIAAAIAMIFPLLWLALVHLSTIAATRTPIPESTDAVTSRGTLSPPAAVAPPVELAAERRDEETVEGAAGPNTMEHGAAAATPTAREMGRTRSGFDQTVAGLLEFIDTVPVLDEDDRATARLLITEPDMPKTRVAQRLGVDRSTVWRRWNRVEALARTEGFTVPPLPCATSGDVVAPSVGGARELERAGV
ncbi:DUF2637 domain-containing protein [Rhodococcus rhodnii]|uniref:DUF2637 domain-containing protein n=1 Tax=Rhodococcus rhodnii TaxID=38312 RepID=UPI000933AB1A|nr:DUF2637 domain-containing protein [Rhodococcus rhodnii]